LETADIKETTIESNNYVTTKRDVTTSVFQGVLRERNGYSNFSNGVAKYSKTSAETPLPKYTETSFYDHHDIQMKYLRSHKFLKSHSAKVTNKMDEVIGHHRVDSVGSIIKFL